MAQGSKYPDGTKARALELYQAGMRPQEIAEKLGVPRATVGNWAHVAGLRQRKGDPWPRNLTNGEWVRDGKGVSHWVPAGGAA